jgi:hypothetical protein
LRGGAGGDSQVPRMAAVTYARVCELGGVAGRRGTAALPNATFWAAVGGLVRDGVSFSAGGFRRRRGMEAGGPLLLGTADRSTPQTVKSLQAVAGPVAVAAAATAASGTKAKRRVAGLPGWQASCNPLPSTAHRAAAAGLSCASAWPPNL